MNIFKKIIGSLCISAFVLALNPLSGSCADSGQDPYVDGKLSVSRCISKGNIEFGLFLNTFIYSDGFYEGIIEPWIDVLLRNKCHATDISSLINQQDKIRKYIRDAFLTCNNEKIPALKSSFEKLNMEIYFVRHVVDGSVITLLPFETLSFMIQNDPNSLYYPTDKLYSDMYEKYVGNISLSIDEFNQFFAKLDFKYKDRKAQYAVCESDSWEPVVEKWEEFISSAGGIAPAWEDSKKEIGGAVEKLVETTTDGGLAAWYEGRFRSNVNNMPSETGFSGLWNNLTEQIGEEWNKQSPFSSRGNEALTQESLLSASRSADYQYKISEIRNSLTSDFESLYLETSNEGINSVILRLEEFNNIITKSLDPIEKIEEMAGYMNSKQCEGKF
jgi:hypothetical protein